MSKRETSERLRRERRDKGLCVYCGLVAPVDGRLGCPGCLAKNVAKAIQHNKARVAAGMCSTCHNQPAVPGKKTCVRCRDNLRKRTALAVEAGRCVSCNLNPSTDGKRYCQPCIDRWKDGRLALKKKVLAHYGAVCACCGESRLPFLTIDHVNNDGAEHRRKIRSGRGGRSGGGGYTTYLWLVKNGFPSGFQVLCWNCNCARFYHGECPHEAERRIKEV